MLAFFAAVFFVFAAVTVAAMSALRRYFAAVFDVFTGVEKTVDFFFNAT
jgi:hypothetical protein